MIIYFVLFYLGIFVLSGQAAAQNAGPAVTISFLIAGCAAGKIFIYITYFMINQEHISNNSNNINVYFFLS